MFPVLLCNKQFQRLRDCRGCVDHGVYDWGCLSGSSVCAFRLSVRLRVPLRLPQHLPISRKAGHRTQKPVQRPEPGCRRPASLAGLSRGPCEARRARVTGLGPQVTGDGTRCGSPARGARGPPRRPCARPASGTDQAACERRDSCSCLKYAGYFYLPTSGGEGHPTSGRGGCYTMFPFSREGKWREARLPDHMVLKSMKKN